MILGKSKQKTKVLMMDTDFSGHYEDKEIVNGELSFGEQTYPISMFVPLMVKEKGLISDKIFTLYVLKHDTIAPADNINPPKERLASVYPVFKDYKMSPEIYRKLTGMKILANMIKTKKSEMSIIWPFIGLIAGIVGMYVMVGMGYLTIPAMNL